MTILPYILDLAVIILVGGMAVAAYRKGFISSALGFLPIVVSLVATRVVTPYVSQFLRQTPFFGSLSNGISNGLHLENMMGEAAMQTQRELISNMQLPTFLKNTLMENNNPVIYNLLDVENLSSYIAGFLANICINIVSVLVVFIAVWIGMHFLLKAMNLIAKMPVLNLCNRVCGGVVGALKGLCIIWMVCFVLTLFQCNAKMNFLFDAINVSYVAKGVYEHNVLMAFILTIFA